MGRKEDNAKKAVELMKDQTLIRNLGTAAHIDHGKTTFSDNLIAGAGMMSADNAGSQRVLDYDEQEAARGITINAASAAMVVPYRNPKHDNAVEHYLVNLIDTPGHVDFGGDVTRAMRALDGVYILCCAVEGIMPQTETVIRQALKERVKPMLFINKVDRAIVEQQLTPQMMIEKFSKIITAFNQKIMDILPAPLNKQWQVSLQDGTVALGSAYNNWAVSIPYLSRPEVTKRALELAPELADKLNGKPFNLNTVFDLCAQEGGQDKLAKIIPIADVVLEMAINHIQNPVDSQKIRIPTIWHGDLNTKIGKDMLACDPKGDVALMINKIIMDKQAGEIAIGRLFSGTVKKGDTLYISGVQAAQRVQGVYLMVGADRIAVAECKAGNIVALTGLKDAIAGSTVSTLKDMATVCADFRRESGVPFASFFNGLRPAEFQKTPLASERFTWSWSTDNPPCLSCAVKSRYALDIRQPSVVPNGLHVAALTKEAAKKLPEDIDFARIAMKFNITETAALAAYIPALRSAVQFAMLNKSAGYAAAQFSSTPNQKGGSSLAQLYRQAQTVASAVEALMAEIKRLDPTVG